MNDEIATETPIEEPASERHWLCVYGFHSWGKFKGKVLTEEIKGLYKKSYPVRVTTCRRCALVLVKSLV